MRINPLLPLLLLTLSACSNLDNKSSFERKHLQWQEDRIEKLKSKSGWLNLAGLYWLEEGGNSIGSDSSNSIIFPRKAPPSIGIYNLKEGQIHFEPDPLSGITIDGNPASVMEIKTDKSGNPTLFETNNYEWFIIERGGKFAIRLRDYEHPGVRAFQGIESYPPDRKWKIEAEYEEFKKPLEMLIPTISGTMEKNICPGILRFRIGNKWQALYPTLSENGFFIVFADETSGNETYGGGRFIYTGKPGKKGKVEIDFNRAYNPPCAFTPFATCPLPPLENILTVRVEAGEKFEGH